MRIFKTTVQVRDYIAEALRDRADHDMLTAGLGRVESSDRPGLLPYAIDSWDPDANGICEIKMRDQAGLIAWRAFVLAELAAGRGRLSDLPAIEKKLGIEETEPAFDFVKAVVKGSGARPTDGYSWSAGVEWVVEGGAMPDPRKRWARSAWRARAAAHELCAENRLTLPMTNKWQPRPTALFRQPKVHVPPPPRVELTIEDEAMLAELAT
ncbi:MAG: hypothetical protein CFE29_03755 [Bradyrhizobiaceae bacterium PARB1]|jgi:hypothetical protein|nr:MAG: hypothetical protein CFE29_03755 [Bradyrhizobiaceae bacterium PARB1]